MKRKLIKIFAMVLSLAMFMTAASGCGEVEVKTLNGTADNEILTFENNAENKPIIRIGTQYYTPDENLITAIREAFPDYAIVMDYSASAGTHAPETIAIQIENNVPYDIIISGNLKELSYGEKAYLLDLSAETFLNEYLLSALNKISIEGHIYCIPGPATLAGIVYNKDMFEEHGWKVPETTEEFFELCETIKETGIRPFSTCFKYAGQVNRLLGTMCYDELYMMPEDVTWLQDVIKGEAVYKGHMEPFYELAKRFCDTGVITIDDFTASLTKQRHDFWDGKYAMIEYDSAIFTYADTENATFEMGIMPYPAKDSQYSGFSIMPEYYIAIPKLLESDPERLKLAKDILAFLSSEEGQEAMLKGSLRISNVKGVELSDNPVFEYAREAYERGSLYPPVKFETKEVLFLNSQKESVKSIFEGKTPAEAIDMMDKMVKEQLANKEEPEEDKVFAVATEDFTVLETSYYIADKLKEAVGAEVGMMVNNSYFKANLTSIYEGEIKSLQPFVMKGVPDGDYLTSHAMTGAQLKEFMEYPIINGAEIDALIAASGLAIEYAPWNERGERVLSLTFEDGTEISDEELYTVAAFKGVIDEKYITETIKEHSELGNLTDILEKAFIEDGSISPDIGSRVKLIWPEAE